MDRLLAVMAALRDPETGCPWDLAQDWRSIVPHTLEEAYELADAIEHGSDDEALRSELGDVLFQVVFYARLAEEEGRFDFQQVAAGVADKLVRRHPHVFGGAAERDAASQSGSWEAIKAVERNQRARRQGRAPGLLDDVPLALPALSRSAKLQKRAARVGFDWPEATPVLAKIREEAGELEEAMAAADDAAMAEEYGDLLFAMANLGRHLGVDPEQALRDANAKFERRFQGIEAELEGRDQPLEGAGFETLEAAYQRAKARDKNGG